ncbi:hypothetical protein PtB15_4B800 [Puccinia triticina]|nr:hypothetical protein PtB15_4B800 [Puccinia triticina]
MQAASPSVSEDLDFSRYTLSQTPSPSATKPDQEIQYSTNPLSSSSSPSISEEYIHSLPHTISTTKMDQEMHCSNVLSGSSSPSIL